MQLLSGVLCISGESARHLIGCLFCGDWLKSNSLILSLKVAAKWQSQNQGGDDKDRRQHMEEPPVGQLYLINYESD